MFAQERRQKPIDHLGRNQRESAYFANWRAFGPWVTDKEFPKSKAKRLEESGTAILRV